MRFSPGTNTPRLVAVIVTFAVLAAVFPPSASLASRSHVSRASSPTQTCHWVTKTVKGKKKRVKVCTTKPADVQAQAAVKAVTKATSDAARITALEKLMAAVHVGVYKTGTGAVIVRGAEKSPKDFYLYDYEIAMLNGALGRQEYRSLADVATVLTNMGIKPAGKAVDPDFLRRALIASVQGAMKHTKKAVEIVPLVIRDLGLSHPQPYDLAQDVPATAIQLDSVQTMLLMADIMGPVVRFGITSHTATRATAHLPGACKVINIVTSPFNPNTYLDFFGVHINFVGDAALGGQISDFVKAVTLAEHAVDGANLAYTVLMGLHGMLLAYSIKIESLPDMHPSSHYGPAGGNDIADAGKPMVFRAKVTMQDDLGAGLTACINDAGFSVPKKGPVAGVPIDWSTEDEDLEKYGTITFSPSDQKTGPDGISTMVFYPHNEKAPGFGTFVTKTGGATPRALWGMAFENLLGTVNELITPKLGEEYGWTVSYHRARGFKFSNLTWTVHDNFGIGYPDSTSTFTVSGSICGDDPQSGWDLHVHEVSNWPVFGHYQFDGTYDLPWTPAFPMPTQSSLGDAKTSGIITSGPSPQIKVRIQTTGEQAGPRDQTVTAPVYEDTSCPDNSED